MSADILPDGKLSYAKAYATGGIGHDIPTQDGLFSQDSVVVHKAEALLAAVNVSTSFNQESLNVDYFFVLLGWVKYRLPIHHQPSRTEPAYSGWKTC